MYVLYSHILAQIIRHLNTGHTLKILQIKIFNANEVEKYNYLYIWS